MEKNKIKNNKKVWGLYPGFLSQEEIDKLDEVNVWLILYHVKDEFIISKNNSESYMEACYTTNYLIYYTRNFGVEFDCVPSCDTPIIESESFKKWFKMWKKHFHTMPKFIFESFVKDRKAGNDISKYMLYDKSYTYERTRKKY